MESKTKLFDCDDCMECVLYKAFEKRLKRRPRGRKEPKVTLESLKFTYSKMKRGGYLSEETKRKILEYLEEAICEKEKEQAEKGHKSKSKKK